MRRLLPLLHRHSAARAPLMRCLRRVSHALPMWGRCSPGEGTGRPRCGFRNSLCPKHLPEPLWALRIPGGAGSPSLPPEGGSRKSLASDGLRDRRGLCPAATGLASSLFRGGALLPDIVLLAGERPGLAQTRVALDFRPGGAIGVQLLLAQMLAVAPRFGGSAKNGPHAQLGGSARVAGFNPVASALLAAVHVVNPLARPAALGGSHDIHRVASRAFRALSSSAPHDGRILRRPGAFNGKPAGGLEGDASRHCPRSADFQSAVSQDCILQSDEVRSAGLNLKLCVLAQPCRLKIGDTADCKSALRRGAVRGCARCKRPRRIQVAQPLAPRQTGRPELHMTMSTAAQSLKQPMPANLL